jgi:hypothetical protein
MLPSGCHLQERKNLRLHDLQASGEGEEDVNHHIRNATKMISKTPRTDRQHILNFGPNLYVKIGFARQLERQLRGANEKIKRLELQIDELGDLVKWLEGR